MKHDFCYISKKNPEVKEAYQNILNLIHEVQGLVRDDFTFQYTPVGSYQRNMITYDSKSNVGFDFDFNIEVNDDDQNYTAKQIKNILQDAFNQVVHQYGYDYPEDSTRVLTIKKKDRKNSRILHSCDFAIINNYIDEDGYDCQEYIHFNKKQNSYNWCDQPRGFYMLPEKVEWIKENDLWNEMKQLYLQKKDDNEDEHVHSRSIFASAVHQICQQNGFFNE